MRKHALLRVAIIILTLSVAVALIAEHAEFTYFPDQVGTIQPVKVETGPGKGWNLSPSEQKVFYGNLTTLRDSFLAQPVFKPPKGFQVSGYARAEGEGGRSGIPVRGWGRFRYIPYVVSNDYNTGKPSPGKAPYPWEYLESDVYLHVNDPTAGIGHFGAGGPYFPFDDTPVLIQPQKIGERQGFALYSSKPGDQVSPFLVLTRSAKPLWVPMSQEKFLQILIKHYDARRAAGDSDYRSADPANNMRAALAKMSPHQRQQQAYYLEHYDYSPPLAPAGTMGAQPLVMPNPELFDPALPRTAIQLVTVCFDAAWNLKNPQGDRYGSPVPLRQAQTLDTSDWKAISAILGH